MTAENILNALNDVPDRYILDAQAPVRRSRRTLRRLAAVAAVLALCVALAVPAAAYTNTGYSILYDISPTVAQALKPVNESCEKNGVRMTVDSAVIEDNTAYIRIAMTDLAGDLFDGTIDLYDSYGINRAFDSGASCDRESYDESTHTATWLVQLSPLVCGTTQDDGTVLWEEPPVLEPGKVTFHVGEFYGHTDSWDAPVEGVDLTAAGQDQATFVQETDEYDLETNTSRLVRYDCLTPGEPTEICPGAAITGVGWVDGKLHVQVCKPDFLGGDSRTSGVIYLTDQPDAPAWQGGYIPEYALVQFYSEDERDSYEEYIFDITPQQAQSLTLKGHYQICTRPVEGPWEVTFRLQ